MLMNLPRRDLAADHVVRGGEEVGRLRMLARERAEHELRHRHVGGRVDAVPRDVAEHDREPAVLEREEVVDVAADVDPRRRLVHLADLQPLDHRPRPRQQRALHRVGELLLLLVEAGVVDRERGLRGDRSRRLDRLLRERAARPEGEDRRARRPPRSAARRERRPPSSPSRGTGRAPAGTARRVAAGRSRNARRSRKSRCTLRWPNGTGWERIARDRLGERGVARRGRRAARAVRAARRASARPPRRRRAPRRRCARAPRASRRAERLCAKERDTS